MRGLKNKFFKMTTVGLLSACLMATFVACGSSSSFDKKMESAASAPQASMSNGTGGLLDYGYYEDSVMVEEEKVVMESATESGSTADSGTSQAAAMERKLIKTVDMNVETQEYDALMSTIQSQVNALGGYIESMNTYNGSRYYDYNPTRNADMTLRIPKDRLDDFLNTMSEISNVVRRSDNVEDVTLAYVDLESHKEALRTEQTRLLELLERAESIEDIITIEQRLSDVRYQLESMESQLRTYDNQVDYSTVYLSIEEVEVFTPVEEETVWERISGGFMESLDNIGNGFVEFGIWFIIHIPYLALWAVFVVAFVCFILWLIKHSTKPAKNTAEMNTGAPMNNKLEQNTQNAEKKN